MVSADAIAFVRAALPPGRVLEVGAGEGELASVLAGAGWDVVAIDPAGGEGVRPVALLDLDEPDGSFDGAVAMLSLHHVEPLAESVARLAALLRPGAVLAVDELDIDRIDSRALAWWGAQRVAAGFEAPGEEMLEAMRAHLHSLETVIAALASHFVVGGPVRGAYLHRWHLPPGLRDAEEALLAAGDLPAVGARLVATRR